MFGQLQVIVFLLISCSVRREQWLYLCALLLISNAQLAISFVMYDSYQICCTLHFVFYSLGVVLLTLQAPMVQVSLSK